jgi:hypothetical protein
MVELPAFRMSTDSQTTRPLIETAGTSFVGTTSSYHSGLLYRLMNMTAQVSAKKTQMRAMALYHAGVQALQRVTHADVAYPQTPRPFLKVPSTPAPRTLLPDPVTPCCCWSSMTGRIAADEVVLLGMRAHPLAEWTPGVGVTPQKHRLRTWRCHALRWDHRMRRSPGCLATANDVVPQHVTA